MSEEKLVRHNLSIGGRSYPVKIEKSEVADLKNIEADANRKINEFMLKYPNYDRIDLLAMAFLSMIFDLNKKRMDRSTPALEKRLDDLVSMLDDTL